MRQHILPEARAEMKPPKKLKNLLRQIKDAQILRRRLADLLRPLRELRFRLLNFFFYLCRLNPAILHEFFERHAAPSRGDTDRTKK